MPARKRVLTALVTALVVGSTAAPAVAASEEVARDAGRDVVSGSITDQHFPNDPTPARRLGDITRTTVGYGSDLVVTTKFRSLTATGHQEFQWLLLTSTDADAGAWSASLVVGPGKNGGRFTLIDPIANQPGCGRARLDRSTRTVTLTVPAACLGDPDWVRIGNGIFFYDATHAYVDDARRDGVARGDFKYGPKLTAAQ